ncbi:MAG: tetratricopeptide repeat protein [Methylovulum sp.]|nr:tetratricopeptide repeat protein [Methylovulum sp.]
MSATYNQIIQQGIQARQANNRQDALALFKEAIALDPAQFSAYREAGTECRDLGLFSEAESFYQQAQERAPKDVVTAIQWALCNRRQGKHRLCLQQLRVIADNNRKNGWICNEMAITLKQMGRLAKAEQWFRLALAALPTNIHALLEFGLLARMSGNRALALAQFETIIKYHPTHIQAYIETATELQALGRHDEAIQILQLIFVRTQNLALLEKYLLILFDQNALNAVHELFLHAAHYPISDALIQRFFNYVLICPQDIAGFNVFPKSLAVTLLSQQQFSTQLITLKRVRFDSFMTLLAYFEPLLISLVADNDNHLINNKLFVLLIIYSAYKKNDAVMHYVIGNSPQYIASFSFSDICKTSSFLAGLTSHHFVLSLFSKAAITLHSADCLLASLIMLGYYPDEPCLVDFADKETLLKLLPFFCEENNEATLKNIFIHLLQKDRLTLPEIEALYPKPTFLATVKAVDDVLKPLFQSNQQKYIKPEKLNVALCISGQLRGYKAAFASVKKAIVEPLQPDIFVHTWKDVGFKEPESAIFAARVFQGNFLQAYQNLFISKKYAYKEIRKMLPTVFSLLSEEASVTQQQLKEFYQTDSIVVEDDTQPPFSTFTNQKKMYYKIDACNQLAQATGKRYDLVIRLRPDMGLYALEQTDWLQIAELCNSSKTLFIDSCAHGGLHDFLEFGGGIYGIGDTAAIGSQSSMNYYASIPKFRNAFVEHGLAHFFVESSHIVLAHGLWISGYSKKDPFPLGKKGLLNTSLKAEEILQAIQNDLPNLDKDVADELVSALEQDIIKQS